MVLSFLGFLNLSLIDILDIILVALIIYVLFKWIKGSSAMNIFLAIILLLVARIVALAFNMKMISSILGTVIDVGAVGVIVIFQPEIRRFLNNIGSSAGNKLGKRAFLQKFLKNNVNAVSDGSTSEIADACMEMGAQKTGALIVLRRNNSLEDIISTGDTIDARICSRLIMNLFFKNSPLHDGAMIIGGDRIIAARCTLPITDRLDIPASFGMRHKAALGLSEQNDADVIVVSEETGRVSFVHSGKVTEIKSANALKLLIMGGKTE